MGCFVLLLPGSAIPLLSVEDCSLSLKSGALRVVSSRAVRYILNPFVEALKLQKTNSTYAYK